MDIVQISQRVKDVRNKHYARDQRMSNVQSVRAGDVQHVVPGMLPDAWPKSTVANIIDIAARVVSEAAGVLPTVVCTSGVNVSDRQKKYANKRTLIAHHYVQSSKLKTSLIQAADWFEMYGFLPFIVEPSFDKLDLAGVGPRIRVEHPQNCYYTLTPWGRVKSFFKVFDEDIASLIVKFPDARGKLLTGGAQGPQGSLNTRLELVWWMDDDEYVLYAPQRNNLVLLRMDNQLGRCPVFVAERPRFDDETRGAFDDVVWIQLLRMRLSMLSLRVLEQSVNAPLGVPMDVTKFSYGPTQMIRSNDPDRIKRVGLEVSPAAMQMPMLLQQEIFTAARFPEGATGKSPGSVVTGAGMDALMGTIDSRVRTTQALLGEKLQDSLVACFEMDEKFWPGTSRKLRVNVNGVIFEETYKPRADISGVYQVDVTYGMMAGMDVNRAMVFLLQGRGDDLFSREFVLKNLPFDINPEQIQQQTHKEKLEDGTLQGLIAALAATGQMAMQGQDPANLLLAGVKAIQAIEKGTPVAEAIQKALEPPKPPPGSGPPGDAQDQSGPSGLQAPGGAPQGGPPGMGGPPGGSQGPGGQPPLPLAQSAPGQAGQGPGGQPSIQALLAGLTQGGAPNMQANVKRRMPAG